MRVHEDAPQRELVEEASGLGFAVKTPESDRNAPIVRGHDKALAEAGGLERERLLLDHFRDPVPHVRLPKVSLEECSDGIHACQACDL